MALVMQCVMNTWQIDKVDAVLAKVGGILTT